MLYSLDTAIFSWHVNHTAIEQTVVTKYLDVHSSFKRDIQRQILRHYDMLICDRQVLVGRFCYLWMELGFFLISSLLKMIHVFGHTKWIYFNLQPPGHSEH